MSVTMRKYKNSHTPVYSQCISTGAYGVMQKVASIRIVRSSLHRRNVVYRQHGGGDCC